MRLANELWLDAISDKTPVPASHKNAALQKNDPKSV